MAVDKCIDFAEGPNVAMWHANFDTNGFVFLHEVVALFVAVQRVGKIIGAIDEKNGARCSRQIFGRIKIRHPFCSFVFRHFVEVRFFPDAIFMQKATAINRNCCFESVVQACHYASKVSTPANAGDCGTIAIDFGKTGYQGMSSDYRGYSMISPHITDIIPGELQELFLVGLVGSSIIKSAIGTMAGKIHGQGTVTPFCPMSYPVGERFAPAPMNQHYGRKGSVSCRLAIVGKDAGRLSLVGFAGIINLPDTVGLFPPGMRNLCFLQFLHIPGAAEFSGLIGWQIQAEKQRQ